MSEPQYQNYSHLSIVAPAYNEEHTLDSFYSRVTEVMRAYHIPYEIVYVDDGSSDNTRQIMAAQAAHDEHVTVIEFSRNFGKEIAMTAGLDHTTGDLVVVIDVDLQDPPEVIPQLIEQWRKGYDVVYAQRTERKGEGLFKRASSYLFYRLLGRISDIDIPPDTGDFRLMTRRAVNALLQLREHHRYMKGLFAWVGYPQKAVLYERDARSAGETKWNTARLFSLAFEGITSFSTTPLRMVSYMGITVAIISLLFGVYIVAKKIFLGDPVVGYASLVAVITFIGSMQLIALGIIGEYLGRIFNESKQRPLYLLKNQHLSRWHQSKDS